MEYFKLWTDLKHSDLLDRVRYLESLDLEHIPMLRHEISQTEFYCGLCCTYKKMINPWCDLILIACNPNKYIFEGEIVLCRNCLNNHPDISLYLQNELCSVYNPLETPPYKMLIYTDQTITSNTTRCAIYNVSRNYSILLGTWFPYYSIIKLRSENPCEFRRRIDIDYCLFDLLRKKLHFSRF